MAAQAVFETAELLEMVLMGIDAHTLLYTQRVNRFWRNTIQSSLALKRALFLETDGGPTVKLVKFIYPTTFCGGIHKQLL